MRMVLSLAAALAAAVIALPAAAGAAGGRAADGQLVGSVGPGFSISLQDGSGAAVTHLDPGTYTLLVHDQADVHDFHFVCGDANVSTEVAFVGDRTFTVTLKDGSSCDYYCDPHVATMHGTFTVGTVAAPPATSPTPPTARTASLTVGPGRTATAPKTLRAGTYVLSLVDRSARDNVHLKGPGVDRKTGIAFVGTAKVRVTLKRGVYTLSSDATRTLVRRIVVR